MPEHPPKPPASSTPPEGLARLQKAFADHIRDPENHPVPAGVEDRRMAVYRGLFFRNLRGLISRSYPVVRKLYDDETWDGIIRDFMIRHRPTTPVFPEMPREFLRYLQDVRDASSDPPFLIELAHYEWQEVVIGLDQAESEAVECDPQGDPVTGIPVPTPVLRQLRYTWPVHRISPAYRPDTPPDQPTDLLVYRNREYRVRFMALNPVSMRLVQLLQENRDQPGLAILKRIAEELKHPDPDKVIAGGRKLLADLVERDIILGTR